MTVTNSGMNLRRFDLNLLPILKALMATHSVARASEILGLGQSATSGALSRLRVMFGDPLLVLVGRNLVPTPYAEELVSLLDTVFVDLHALLDRRAFDPREEERRFLICTSDYAIDELGLPLLTLLAEEAPHVTVRFVEISTHRSAMISGEIDFMITPQNIVSTGSEDFHSLPLYEDDMVIIASKDFPMPAGGLDLDTYLASKHVCYGASDRETFEEWAMAKHGLSQITLVTVPHFNQLPRYVAAIPCLSMLPRHVAERHVAAYGLRIWDVPFEMPRLQMSIHWSHVLNRNPAHKWFRGLITRAWSMAQEKELTR